MSDFQITKDQKESYFKEIKLSCSTTTSSSKQIKLSCSNCTIILNKGGERYSDESENKKYRVEDDRIFHEPDFKNF